MARASKQGDFNATPLAATTLAAGLPLLPDLCARGCCVSGRSRASLALGNCAVQAGCRVIGGSEEALHTLLARIAARGRALGATSQRARSAVAVGIDIVALEEQGEEGARLKPPNSLSDSLTHIPPTPWGLSTEDLAAAAPSGTRRRCRWHRTPGSWPRCTAGSASESPDSSPSCMSCCRGGAVGPMTRSGGGSGVAAGSGAADGLVACPGCQTPASAVRSHNAAGSAPHQSPLV